jgi:O-antigen/teichoic acid export membrane protein
MLGKVGFGEFGIIQSTVGLFSVFAGLGLGLTATKYVAEFREKDPAKAGRIIALSIWIAILSGSLLMLALVFAAPWLATNTLAAPQIGGLLQVSSLLIALGAMNGAQTGALAGFEAFREIARVNLWSGIATFPLIVLGTITFGLPGAVWGLVGGSIVSWTMNRRALSRKIQQANIKVTLSGCQEEFSILWKFSFPALLGSMLVGPVTWLCYTMLVNQPNGYAEMGAFNAANQWFILLMFLPGMLEQATLPMLSERLGHGDEISTIKILKTSITANVGVIFPLIIIGSLLSGLIMSVYGAGFQEKWLTLVIVLFTAGLLAMQSPISVLLQASGKIWLLTSTNFVWAGTFLLATFLLVSYGASGLATARAIAYTVNGLVIFAYAYYMLRSSKLIST